MDADPAKGRQVGKDEKDVRDLKDDDPRVFQNLRCSVSLGAVLAGFEIAEKLTVRFYLEGPSGQVFGRQIFWKRC